MGVGFLETREPKSVTAGIQWRGEWDVIRDRGNKRELKVKIVENTVVYGSEVLEFKLNVSHTEPLKESDFIVVQERLLKDVSDSLMLLCMCQWVVNMSGNGGLL